MKPRQVLIQCGQRPYKKVDWDRYTNGRLCEDLGSRSYTCKPPREASGETSLPTPWCGASSLHHYKEINSCCLGLPGHCAVVTLGNWTSECLFPVLPAFTEHKVPHSQNTRRLQKHYLPSSSAAMVFSLPSGMLFLLPSTHFFQVSGQFLLLLPSSLSPASPPQPGSLWSPHSALHTNLYFLWPQTSLNTFLSNPFFLVPFPHPSIPYSCLTISPLHHKASSRKE